MIYCRIIGLLYIKTYRGNAACDQDKGMGADVLIMQGKCNYWLLQFRSTFLPSERVRMLEFDLDEFPIAVAINTDGTHSSGEMRHGFTFVKLTRDFIIRVHF